MTVTQRTNAYSSFWCLLEKWQRDQRTTHRACDLKETARGESSISSITPYKITSERCSHSHGRCRTYAGLRVIPFRNYRLAVRGYNARVLSIFSASDYTLTELATKEAVSHCPRQVAVKALNMTVVEVLLFVCSRTPSKLSSAPTPVAIGQPGGCECSEIFLNCVVHL